MVDFQFTKTGDTWTLIKGDKTIVLNQAEAAQVLSVLSRDNDLKVDAA